jgi:hypothetical protein
MEIKVNLNFEKIFKLANQLPSVEKEKLIIALKKTLHKRHKSKKTRQIGKYDGQGWMADDFNAPLADFKDYTL